MPNFPTLPGVGRAMRAPPPLPLDARLASIQRSINAMDRSHLPTSSEGRERDHAAVSLVLRAGPELDLLLIRRAEVEGDPWSGHMALPGGRRDPLDETLLHTAIRETAEETGLRLGESGVALGPMTPLAPATRRLPPISIFPFVFGVPDGAPAHAASPEVDEVLWTPISYLLSPEASGTVQIPLGDDDRVFPCLRVEHRVIWGLTYRILQEFFGVFRASVPGGEQTTR